MDKIKNFIKNNDTNIMIGMGVGSGLGLGSYIWFKTGQKYNKIVSKKEQELNRKLTFKEKLKNTWKLFIFPTVNTCMSAAAIIYATKVNNARYAALGAAYNLTEVAFQKYMDKTRDIVGKNKEEEIKQAIAQDNISTSEKKDKIVMLGTSKDDVLIHEPLTDRYFRSSWNAVINAQIELNLEASSTMSGKIKLSDWFYKLGLPKTDISDDIGWDVQKHGNSGKIDVTTSLCQTEDYEPALEIYYNTRPEYLDN